MKKSCLLSFGSIALSALLVATSTTAMAQAPAHAAAQAVAAFITPAVADAAVNRAAQQGVLADAVVSAGNNMALVHAIDANAKPITFIYNAGTTALTLLNPDTSAAYAQVSGSDADAQAKKLTTAVDAVGKTNPAIVSVSLDDNGTTAGYAAVDSTGALTANGTVDVAEATT